MIGFSDIQTTAVTALAIVGGFMVVASFVDKIRGWLKPRADKDASVEERLDKHDVALSVDKGRLDAYASANRALLSCTAALIDHSIYGNNLEELKKKRAELNEYLIDR